MFAEGVNLIFNWKLCEDNLQEVETSFLKYYFKNEWSFKLISYNF